MRITILGSGAAPGVPSIASGWGRCNPADARNRRRRSSILVEEAGTTVLIDTSPDLREQLLDCGAKRLDAVLYTHGHADHIHGIDELREINRLMNGPIPAHATAETLETLEKRFGYAFQGIPPGKPVFRPWLQSHLFEPGQSFTIGGIPIRTFLQDHGFCTTIGFRLGEAVYSTDLMDLPEASKDVIRGAKLWIVGALQDAPHPSHAHLEKVLGWIAELKPHRAVITHMSNDLDYDTLVSHLLPVGVTPAFDGLVVEV